jgi:hypothetical protein
MAAGSDSTPYPPTPRALVRRILTVPWRAPSTGKPDGTSGNGTRSSLKYSSSVSVKVWNGFKAVTMSREKNKTRQNKEALSRPESPDPMHSLALKCPHHRCQEAVSEDPETLPVPSRNRELRGKRFNVRLGSLIQASKSPGGGHS